MPRGAAARETLCGGRGVEGLLKDKKFAAPTTSGVAQSAVANRSIAQKEGRLAAPFFVDPIRA